MENKVKQIVFVNKNTAQLLDVECGTVGKHDIKVQTIVSSISCGTERANLIGDPNINPNGEGEVQFPRYTGYSSSGVVVEIGSAVKSICVGDRVCISWSVHKQFNILNEKYVTKIENDSISYQEAALCHIGTFPMAAIRKCRLEIGESLMVMGLGILGLFAVTFAHAAGAAPVIAVDPVADRREKALKFGADYAFDPYDADFAEKVKAVTGGGVNVAIEVTGVGAGLNECLDCMARFGRVALLGCTRNKNFTVDYYRQVHGPGIQIIGAHTNARPEFESSSGMFTLRDDILSILKLCGFNRFHLEDMVDEVYSPIECEAVYERLIHDRNFPAIVQFDWRKLR